MSWDLRLIALYLEISEHYDESLWFECERFSNGGYKRCTDDRGNSEQFIWFLRQLHQASPDKKLVIILDNGSIHKSKKVQDFVLMAIFA